MDDAKLRAELDKLAQLGTEKHEAAAIAEAKGKTVDVNFRMGQVRGILRSIEAIGLICEPPLEVVSQGPRYVVREKVAKGAEELYAESRSMGRVLGVSARESLRGLADRHGVTLDGRRKR